MQLQIASKRRTANPRARVTIRPRLMLFKRAKPGGVGRRQVAINISNIMKSSRYVHAPGKSTKLFFVSRSTLLIFSQHVLGIKECFRIILVQAFGHEKHFIAEILIFLRNILAVLEAISCRRFDAVGKDL